MCGEVEESIQVGEDLNDRMRVMAKMLGIGASVEAIAGPENLSEAKGRAAYMDQLFKLGLARCLADVGGAESDEKVDALASQAIAFARLAGFLAGQLPPEADLLRGVIEALMAGVSEPGHLERDYWRAQDEAHGHSHHHDDDDGHHHHDGHTHAGHHHHHA